MPIVLILIFGFAVLKFAVFAKPTNDSDGVMSVYKTGNKWGLPDIDSHDQCGGYDRAFDESFEKASGRTGVPFALIKAHAIRESSLDSQAYNYDNKNSGASYGLMQVEFNKDGKNCNRLSKYGYPADLVRDGSILYDPDVSAYLGACIMRDNLDWQKGGLRNAINAYNTGVPETTRIAPKNYVNDVLSYYGKIIGGPVI